jgi:CspA family cold shock protein
MRSRVKWFKDEKGYGFIKYNEQEDIFVHYSSIQKEGYKTLKKDDEVEFDLIETSKGYQAINTRKIEQ